MQQLVLHYKLIQYAELSKELNHYLLFDFFEITDKSREIEISLQRFQSKGIYNSAENMPVLLKFKHLIDICEKDNLLCGHTFMMLMFSCNFSAWDYKVLTEYPQRFC